MENLYTSKTFSKWLVGGCIPLILPPTLETKMVRKRTKVGATKHGVFCHQKDLKQGLFCHQKDLKQGLFCHQKDLKWFF